MKIQDLRNDLPEWTWTAEHRGMEWRYRGRKDHRAVLVYAVARLSGHLEDHYYTVWYADEGTSTDTYVHFWIQETNMPDDETQEMMLRAINEG